MAAAVRVSYPATLSFRYAWLFGARTDLAAFLGATALSLALLAVGALVGARSTPTWVWIACVVGVDVAHVHATAFRVYFDRAEVLRRPLLYLGTPIAAYAVGVALHHVWGALVFWRVLAYLAVWHFVRQQVGWVALYRARAGERGDPTRRLDAWLDPAATYAAAVYPLVYWHAHLPRPFSWFVNGDFAIGLPAWVVPFARTVWGVLLVLFIARQLHLVREACGAGDSGGVNVGKCIVVLGTFVTWWVGIVACASDYAFTVTNVLPHGIPYLVLVATYARGRYLDPQAPRASLAPLLLRGGVRLGFALAFVLLVVVALAEEGAWDRLVWHDHEGIFGEGHLLSARALGWWVPLLALPQAVHYVLDGAIWKRGRNPALARYLSVKL